MTTSPEESFPGTMADLPLSDQDVVQIQAHGLTLDQVRQQLRLFARPPRFLELARPATVTDGIQRLSPADMEGYLSRQDEAARQGRFAKFVPASGVATRMFQLLCHYFYHVGPDLGSAVQDELEQGTPQTREFLAFFHRLPQFAFFPDLKDRLAAQGHDLQDLLSARGYGEILSCVLTEAGLCYQDLPKALIKFHAYGDQGRTALEEHLVEAAAYVRDRDGKCCLHFTILPRHRQAFQELLSQTQPALENFFGCRFKIDFSYQHRGTDTLAVDADNRPFRDRQGRLVFRPGGHGSLLANLNELQGDLVYIKNIDNVVPDRLKEPTIQWKKILGGLLVTLQDQIHRHLRTLEQGSGQEMDWQEILKFVQEKTWPGIS
jgi:hypothetical protein